MSDVVTGPAAALDEVFIAGDLPPDEDRYWGPDPEVDEAEAEAIEQVRACRELSDRLWAAAARRSRP